MTTGGRSTQAGRSRSGAPLPDRPPPRVPGPGGVRAGRTRHTHPRQALRRLMRVVSLVPAATEIVAALGAEGSLAGISHECDWPPSVRQLPPVTTTPIDPSGGSGAIDAEVDRLQAEGRPVIGVDGAALAARLPDLILTQDLCDVCAVVDGDVRALASALDPAPALLALRARTLEGLFADFAGGG